MSGRLVRYLGVSVHASYDDGMRRHIELRTGEAVVVSDEKAAMLTGDDWQDVGSGEDVMAATRAVNVIAARRGHGTHHDG